MKKRLLTLITACMVLLMASAPAYATSPTEVSGIFDIDVTVTGIRTAGTNMFIYGTDEEWWQEDLEGYVAETEFVVRAHASGEATFKSRYLFEGTVLGSETGTMEMQLVGQQSAPGEWWYGTWVILGGTGGLANVHGQGVWYGPGMGNDPDHWYEGQVHFDP